MSISLTFINPPMPLNLKTCCSRFVPSLKEHVRHPFWGGNPIPSTLWSLFRSLTIYSPL